MYEHEVLRYNDMKIRETKKTKKNQRKTNDQKHKTDYRAPIIIGTIIRD
jgi:hypothetical protein